MQGESGYDSAVSRTTTQQQAVWEALDSASGPLLPEEVLSRAQATCPTLGQATVYRALKRLEQDGRVQRVVDLDGRSRFEVERAHHHHFHCRACDQVFDVPGCAARSPAALRRTLPEGFAIESHEVWLRGVCAACR